MICRFHVNLPECRISFYERLHPYTLRSGGWPSIPGEGLGHEFLRHLERTKVTWVQPICWFLLIDVGMEFYLGIYIFFISWKLKLISIFFSRRSPIFFQMSFFCCLPIFKKIHILLFFATKARFKCHVIPEISISHPTVLWECGLGGLDLPGGLCVLTGSLRGFFNLAAGGAGLFCSFFGF